MIPGSSLWNTITGNTMNEKETQLKNFLKNETYIYRCHYI